MEKSADLDGRDSIFGKAYGGLDIVHDIEDAKVDKNDKPFDDIKMSSISIE